MRILQGDKYDSILAAARSEFIANGYKEASMRNIAQNAGVGLSNIYNYFRNKDQIFLAIMEPAKNVLFSFIIEQHTEESVDKNRIAPFGHNEEAIEKYIAIIDKCREEFRLLLFHSEGSSMSDFWHDLTDHMTAVSHDYMAYERICFPDAGTVSDFFIHVQA